MISDTAIGFQTVAAFKGDPSLTNEILINLFCEVETADLERIVAPDLAG